MGAIPSKPTQLILSNILLTTSAEKEEISLTAFDLSLAIRVTIPARIESKGEVTLPAKLLSSLISSLPDRQVHFSLNSSGQENQVIRLDLDNYHYQIRSLDAAEFPSFSEIEPVTKVQLDTDTLVEAVKIVLSAVATDEIRQVLTGIVFTLDSKTIELAGTDGHRLAVVKANLPTRKKSKSKSKTKQNYSFIVPATALKELIKLIGKSNRHETIEVEFDNSKVSFSFPGAKLVSRLLEGQYPNYHAVLPQEFNSEVNLLNSQLSQASQRLLLFNSRQPIVKLDFQESEQQVEMLSDDSELGNGAESIPAVVKGDIKIAFNGKYLIDALKALPTNEVNCQFINGKSPAMLRSLNGDYLSCFILLMPCFMEERG